MSKEINSIDWLTKDPRSKKWIRQCIVCQKYAITIDTPEKYFNKKWLERGLKKMRFNNLGICEDCEKFSQLQQK